MKEEEREEFSSHEKHEKAQKGAKKVFFEPLRFVSQVLLFPPSFVFLFDLCQSV
jgi:hypothetical protein